MSINSINRLQITTYILAHLVNILHTVTRYKNMLLFCMFVNALHAVVTHLNPITIVCTSNLSNTSAVVIWLMVE